MHGAINILHLISVHTSLLFSKNPDLEITGALSSVALNLGSVVLVLIVSRASLLNKPSQTMQRPTASSDEDMGLQ